MTNDSGIYRNALRSEGNFTTVNNAWIRSSGLSPQANFLWIYLLSHKIGYELRDSQILNETGFGPKGLRAARKELKEAGWLSLRRKKNADGSLGTYAYYLQEPRVPQGTVDQGTVDESTVDQGTVPEGPHLRSTNSKKTISKKNKSKEISSIRKPQILNADDYNPPAELLQKLGEEFVGLRMGVELEKFRDHHMAKGSRFKDWDRAFRGWLRRAQGWSPEARAARVQLEEEAKWAKLMEQGEIE